MEKHENDRIFDIKRDYNTLMRVNVIVLIAVILKPTKIGCLPFRHLNLDYRCQPYEAKTTEVLKITLTSLFK
jgi:hypothetical protein